MEAECTLDTSDSYFLTYCSETFGLSTAKFDGGTGAASSSIIDVYTVSLISTYLITSNILPFPTVDDFVHRHHRCY